MMAAPDVPFGKLTFKASHNSYERNETIEQQLTFHPNDPSRAGCRGLELDIWRHSSDFVPYKEISADYFTVAHSSPGNKKLSDYLAQIRSWHDANPGHGPVLVTLDIKSTRGGYSRFNEAIDTYLMCYFGEELIFKPGDLLGGSSLSLLEYVTQQGWPVIRDRFLFCLSGNKEWKALYAEENMEQSYCFSDRDESDSNLSVKPPTGPGNVVFFNFHISHNDRQVWMRTIPPFADSNLIVRVYVANSDNNWQDSLVSNVSAIATDKVSDHAWARVSDDSPYREKRPVDLRSLKNDANGEYRCNRATEMEKVYRYPDCAFVFDRQEGHSSEVYAIRNVKNQEYFDCTISTMSDLIRDDCQLWRLHPAGGSDKYYVQNVQNGEYMTKRASKLSSSRGSDEVYTIQRRSNG